MLKKLGIIKDDKSQKAYEVFNMIGVASDFLSNTMEPKEYVVKCWDEYKRLPIPRNNALNGKVFEFIIASLLIKEKILPLFFQATAAFVPNVVYDAVVYSLECGPISISVKTSLRERYKQADLEAIALKYVHRKAKCFLLTNNEGEAKNVKKKILTGAVIGIDKDIIANSDDINEFVEELNKYKLEKPHKVDVLKAGAIITSQTIKKASR